MHVNDLTSCSLKPGFKSQPGILLYPESPMSFQKDKTFFGREKPQSFQFRLSKFFLQHKSTKSNRLRLETANSSCSRFESSSSKKRFALIRLERCYARYLPFPGIAFCRNFCRKFLPKKNIVLCRELNKVCCPINRQNVNVAAAAAAS